MVTSLDAYKINKLKNKKFPKIVIQDNVTSFHSFIYFSIVRSEHSDSHNYKYTFTNVIDGIGGNENRIIVSNNSDSAEVCFKFYYCC